MRSTLLATFVVGLFSAICQAQTDSHIWGRATTDSPPDCSVDCLTTLVPSYCGTLTNTTCICTSVPLSTALSACAYSACNITETFRFAKYAKDSCGVVSDRSKVDEQLHLYYVLPALSTCFVSARVFARWKLEVGLGPDDWFMLAALAAYLTDVAAGLGIALNGFGQHTYYLTTKQVSNALEFFYIAELFYILSITLTKCSLLLFFNRIFPNKKHRILIYSMLAFVVVSNFALLMALMFQCVPFHGVWTNWMYKVPPVKCINTFAAVYVAAALSIFHDLAILCFPIPILWSLNLAWQKKANLLVMFSVGSFVIICSLLRLPSLMKMGGSSDPSYDQAPVAIWTDLEIAVGIICGCLPACRSLIGWIFPSLKMSLANSSGRQTPGYMPKHPSISHSRNFSRKRTDTTGGSRSFIELSERGSSHDDLENGKKSDRMSTGSQTPITEKLYPGVGKGYGMKTVVDGRESLECARNGRKCDKEKGKGIMMTRTVEMTRQEAASREGRSVYQL